MVICPNCKWQGNKFLPFGINLRLNAKCPECGSLERHRLFYLYLKTIIPRDKLLRVLHFAPEKIIADLFKSFSNIDYLSVDINPVLATKKENIMSLSFKDNLFDIIFCSHVLEHIRDDVKALKELYRVLKPDNFAIIQMPIYNHNKTFEDFRITNPKEKEKIFKQADHFRRYGKDYKNRLEKVGFRVKIDKYIDSLSKEIIKKNALIPNISNYPNENNYINLCFKKI